MLTFKGEKNASDKKVAKFLSEESQRTRKEVSKILNTNSIPSFYRNQENTTATRGQASLPLRVGFLKESDC
jgi:hypothetical protein